MKRSEFVNKLMDKLNEGQYQDYQFDYEDVNELVIFIESLGMAPPETCVLVPIESDGKQYPLVPGDFKLEDGLWYTPQQKVWDQE